MSFLTESSQGLFCVLRAKKSEMIITFLRGSCIMQENIQIQEEQTMSGQIKAILFKSQPSRILGDRHCYIGLESTWETAIHQDSFYNAHQPL
jgi:hypothetical protein